MSTNNIFELEKTNSNKNANFEVGKDLDFAKEGSEKVHTLLKKTGFDSHQSIDEKVN